MFSRARRKSASELFKNHGEPLSLSTRFLKNFHQWFSFHSKGKSIRNLATESIVRRLKSDFSSDRSTSLFNSHGTYLEERPHYPQLGQLHECNYTARMHFELLRIILWTFGTSCRTSSHTVLHIFHLFVHYLWESILRSIYTQGVLDPVIQPDYILEKKNIYQKRNNNCLV